jgi:hypothetical protein
MSGVSIPVGDVDFYDKYQPLIDAGAYTIAVKQAVASKTGAKPLPTDPFTLNQKFTVVAPRFRLPAGDLQASFPPPNAAGDFGQNLPHVVLNQRALPWERPLGATLLTYEIATTPDPIVTGSTDVKLTIDAGGAAGVKCRSIVVTLPASLAPVSGRPTASRGWTVTQSGGAFTLTAPAGGDSEVQLDVPGVTAGAAGTQLVQIAETDEAGTTRSATVPMTVVAQDSKAGPMSPNVSGDPWLAVLLFTPDEIAMPDGTSTSTLSNPTLTLQYPVKDVIGVQDAGKTLGPAVTAEEFDETTCTAFDISTATFEMVVPRLDELRWLAHARQVNVTDKETSAALQDGWFSIVVANRFPAVAAGKGQLNIAHLVSLEGFAQYLTGSPQWPAGAQKVRLVSLAAWSFSSQPAPANFHDLMKNLVAKAQNGGDALRLRLDAPSLEPPPAKGTPGDLAQTALAQGYVALGYDTRAGAHTYGWYHGPFVPHPIEEFSAVRTSSAAATIYDKQTGTFDLSYAAAWETGRLLALSDRAYTISKARSQRSARRMLHLLRDRAHAGAPLDDTAVEPDQRRRSFGAWLEQELATRLPTPGRPATAPSGPTSGNGARPGVVAELRALLERRDVRPLLEQHVRASLRDGPLSHVADWLAQLRLLNGVPFANLVPDARMLQAESLRFFYVDPNYLDALCDGAQSVLTRSSLDRALDAAIRDLVRGEAIARAHRHRANLIGAAEHADVVPADPVSGLLLRSAAVSGWPGLEVRAFEHADGVTGQIKPVRIDRLAPDVLLCLFPKVPAWIEIDEPRETLAFGVEQGDNGSDVVNLRSLDASEGGKETGGSVTLTASAMRDGQLRTADGASRVLDVDKWQAYVGSQNQPGFAAAWGPAGFAVQMVRAPEQMIFQNQAGF